MASASMISFAASTFVFPSKPTLTKNTSKFSSFSPSKQLNNNSKRETVIRVETKDAPAAKQQQLQQNRHQLALREEPSSVQRWLTTAPCSPTTHWYQIRCILSQPIYIMTGQEITGNLRLVSHSAQSYTIYFTLSAKMWGLGAEQGGILQTSTFKLELKEPYNWVSQPQPYTWAQDQQQHQQPPSELSALLNLEEKICKLSTFSSHYNIGEKHDADSSQPSRRQIVQFLVLSWMIRFVLL